MRQSSTIREKNSAIFSTLEFQKHELESIRLRVELPMILEIESKYMALISRTIGDSVVAQIMCMVVIILCAN